jgi:signal peptidase I
VRRDVLSLAVAGLLAALVLRSRLTLITVTGDSMWPALAPGDQVLVRRTRLGRVRPGQVVVVEAPGTDGYGSASRRGGLRADRYWIIKRVAAVPGDPRPDDIQADQADPLVPPGKFVVLGDNAAWSHDSRHIGYVPGDRLLGVVIRRIARTSRRDAHRPASYSPPAGRIRSSVGLAPAAGQVQRPDPPGGPRRR